jgi:hypothetical protein
MSLFIRFEGLSEAQGTLAGLPDKLEHKTIERLSQVAYDAVQEGARRHTKPTGTGALWQSVFNRPIPTGRMVGHDTQRAPHAVFVLLGTRPHVIRPKTKKALRWVGGNGKFAFAREVNHPGYIGDNYMLTAATLAVQEFAAIIDKSLKEST